MTESSPLRRSPLHDRHTALGAKLADFGGWEMPIEYAGRAAACSRSTTAVRERGRRLRRLPPGQGDGRGPGARDVRQRLPDQRPRPDRARPGAVHDVLRRDRRRRRRPDRLPGRRRRGVPGARTRPTPPRWSRRLAAAAPAGVDGRRPARASSACSRCRARARRRCSAAPGAARRARTTCPTPTPTFDGRPVRICRTGYTGEHGYELIPAWADAPALWDALARGGD